MALAATERERLREEERPGDRYQALSPRQREVVELRCGERELTIAEAAREMNIDPKTLKQHSTEAIRRLGAISFNGACREYGVKDGIERGLELALLRTRPEMV